MKSKIEKLKKETLYKLPDVLLYTCRTYKEMYGSTIEPKLLGKILQGVYNQGVILNGLNTDNTPSKFYLHINDELIDLNYSAEDGIINWKYYTSKLVKNLDGLNMVNEDIVDSQDIVLYTKVIEHLDVHEIFHDFFQHNHNIGESVLKDLNKAYMLNQLYNQNHNSEYLRNKSQGLFNGCKNNLELLENLAKINGGKILEVTDKRTGVSNIFYEKDGIYFNPSDDNNYKSSSLNDIFIKHMFEVNNLTFTTKQILSSYKHLDVSEKENLPFEVIEKSDKDKSVAELLNEFDVLSKRINEISAALKDKTREI